MKRYYLINIVDEDTFCNDVVNNMPSTWNADLVSDNGDIYMTVDEQYEDVFELVLRSYNVRFSILNVQEREYRGYNVTISEDSQYYYINFNTGLGEGSYDKSDFTLESALEDQANLYKEN